MPGPFAKFYASKCLLVYFLVNNYARRLRTVKNSCKQLITSYIFGMNALDTQLVTAPVPVCA
jgi:hypothetical protein